VLLFIAAKVLGIREFNELITRTRNKLSRGGTDAVLPATPKRL